MQVDLSTTGRLYRTWSNMKQRCTNPKASHYGIYGGRGISYCTEWAEWVPFRDWALSNGYSDVLEIERVDVNGNYCPSNCTWVDESHQAATKRKSRTALHTFIGVRPIHGGKWRAVIDVKKVQKHIGVYDTEAEAVQARNTFIVSNNLPHRLN